MHKRNLILSFIIFLILTIGIIIYNQIQPIEPKIVTSKNGYVTLELNSSYRDNYSAKNAPEGLLLLQQSGREDMSVMVAAGIIPPKFRDKTLDEIAKEMEQDQIALGAHLSLKREGDYIEYALKRSDGEISTSRLVRKNGKFIITSVISAEDGDAKKVEAILNSIEYNE